ncbi:unnamed protein product [Adineta ricciae]|uniref:Protein THEM6 n=1 Tax=Adineta ricciae TaxID=249248 RepID=A0A815VI79_ADIRI|nr:unnamed protein product [Adineta ricciae]
MFDLGYFIRASRLFWRSKTAGKVKHILDESIIKGRCWTTDLDTNWHMNNARYLRQCDFGRITLLLENGLWDAVLARRKTGMKDATVLVSALQTQYRQSVQLGDRYDIRTRIHGWDDKAFYLEQAIVLDTNQKIAFLMLIRFALVPRSLTPQMLVDDLDLGVKQSPPFSPSVKAFQENYQLSYPIIKQ